MEQDISLHFHGFYSVSRKGKDPRLDLIRKPQRGSHVLPTAMRPGQYPYCPCKGLVNNTGCECTLECKRLSPKTLIKTIKWIPDEPSKCSSAMSELNPCLVMGFSGLWDFTKKSNYSLDWLWINSPAVKQIFRVVFSSISVCQTTMWCIFLCFTSLY